MTQQDTMANAVRFLSMDAVQKAKSGHPGMPMGMADIATVLWKNYLRHNPCNPDWFNRDRFVLSNGHGSMLLYSLLHLTGYDLSIEELKNFRQLHSQTPGHPEYGYTAGVETTTGPLGQGFANAVGMALAENVLAKEFNRPGYDIVDHYTYVFVGDGCLMEGISHEVASLAGTLELGKLIAFWDNNGISIDGDVSGWFTESVAERFEAYGWHVIKEIDGHDPHRVDMALKAAYLSERPTLICCQTSIGHGAPNKHDTKAAHGAPLGEDEVQKTRELLKWPYKPFEIPDTIYKQWDCQKQGQSLEQKWNELFASYRAQYPELASELLRRINGQLPSRWSETIQNSLKSIVEEQPKLATRKASLRALNHMYPVLPELFGGSADLSGSNLTSWDNASWLNNDTEGRYLCYGVREFGMAGMINGIELHKGLKPFAGTFLIFSDYARNGIRMSALMGIPVIYVLTHDSIGLGEDGPTHQPIEQLASLRLIPGLHLWRPCDAFETQVAWQAALEEQNHPSVLALSRQNVPSLIDDVDYADAVKKGGYVLKPYAGADIVLVATGSEVALALEGAYALAEQNIHAQVVSMPCVEVFKQQSHAYQEQVLQSEVPLLFIEAGVSDYWYCLAYKRRASVIGIDQFGESAPSDDLFEHFNFNKTHVVNTAKRLIN